MGNLEDMNLMDLPDLRIKVDEHIKKRKNILEIQRLKEKISLLEKGKEVFECHNCEGIFPSGEHDVEKCNYLNR